MKFSITPTWGIRIIAAWALVLAVLAVAHLLLLSIAVEFSQGDNQLRMWVIFALNLIFAVGFAFGAYGLWQHAPWGRIVFLWLIGLWSAFNFMSLFAPGLSPDVPRATWQLLLNGVRYGLALAIPLLYLNLPNIKARFDEESSTPSENLTSEEL